MKEILVLNSGSIFDCGADAIVVPVNCTGAMGAGLAKALLRKSPKTCAEYQKAARHGDMDPGDVYYDYSAAFTSWSHTFFLATKDHWRLPSQITWVSRGLDRLVSALDPHEGAIARPISTIAIPALGCGYGQLAWEDVRPLIETAAKRMIAVSKAIVFSPQDRA